MVRPTSGAEVIAHRGASAYEAEHTIAAYDLALAHGADRLELDLRATADGEVVVAHDRTLQRTVGDPRRVDELTRDDLGALPLETRPLLLEAVLWRYGRSTSYLFDLKDPSPAWERRVADAVAGHGLRERVIVQSFDKAALRRLHAVAPWLACAPLYRRRPSARLLDSSARWACGIGVPKRKVDAELVASAHARGLAVRAWTVNAAEDIEHAVTCGVDGLITDVPDVAVEVSGRWSALPAAA